jgi:hypothetical protein
MARSTEAVPGTSAHAPSKHAIHASSAGIPSSGSEVEKEFGRTWVGGRGRSPDLGGGTLRGGGRRGCGGRGGW